MGYRVLTVLMITFLVTGFGWGKKEETTKKKNEQSSSYVATPASKPSFVSSTPSYNAQSQSVVSSGEEQFPTELISTIASGDEDTRKARIDSLKRLSQALSEMKNDGGNTATTETAPAANQTSSNSTYPWGN